MRSIDSSVIRTKTIRPEAIEKILETHDGNRGGLISILEEIQAKCGYLPEEALTMVAQRTAHSMVDLYGVVTFYRSFSLKPRGSHLISVCLGTACHVRRSKSIVEEFERQLNIKAGETTSDRGLTLETVNCLGACALGPIAVLDGQYFSNVDTVKVRQILEKAWGKQQELEIDQDQSVFPLEVSCPRCNHSLMDPGRLIDAHPSIRLVASFGLKHGFLRLSSLYGSYHIESEHEVPEEAVVHFFCPHCHAELKSPSNCIECGAPMVPMIIHGGGMGEICSRRGCKVHRLDLNGAVY